MEICATDPVPTARLLKSTLELGDNLRGNGELANLAFLPYL